MMIQMGNSFFRDLSCLMYAEEAEPLDCKCSVEISVHLSWRDMFKSEGFHIGLMEGEACCPILIEAMSYGEDGFDIFNFIDLTEPRRFSLKARLCCELHLVCFGNWEGRHFFDRRKVTTVFHVFDFLSHLACEVCPIDEECSSFDGPPRDSMNLEDAVSIRDSFWTLLRLLVRRHYLFVSSVHIRLAHGRDNNVLKGERGTAGMNALLCVDYQLFDNKFLWEMIESTAINILGFLRNGEANFSLLALMGLLAKLWICDSIFAIFIIHRFCSDPYFAIRMTGIDCVFPMEYTVEQFISWAVENGSCHFVDILFVRIVKLGEASQIVIGFVEFNNVCWKRGFVWNDFDVNRDVAVKIYSMEEREEGILVSFVVLEHCRIAQQIMFCFAQQIMLIMLSYSEVQVMTTGLAMSLTIGMIYLDLDCNQVLKVLAGFQILEVKMVREVGMLQSYRGVTVACKMLDVMSLRIIAIYVEQVIDWPAEKRFLKGLPNYSDGGNVYSWPDGFKGLRVYLIGLLMSTDVVEEQDGQHDVVKVVNLMVSALPCYALNLVSVRERWRQIFMLSILRLLQCCSASLDVNGIIDNSV